MTTNLLLHFRPRKVPALALNFTLTWGLGGAASLLVGVQLVTGLLLSFVYVPLPVQAYASVQYLQETVFLGCLVRNLHHWSGNALVVILLLHLLRIFLSGALYPPRHWNWLVGLVLGFLILLADFSGYLLPWDQLSYWAVTIVGNMFASIPAVGPFVQHLIFGGGEVGPDTLQLFYTLHTTVIPAALLLCLAYHFWFVRKAGGVLIPAEKKAQSPPSVPGRELLVRECSFAALVFCVLLLFSMVVNAPFGAMADPAFTPANMKAPWYFLGMQELLLHVPAVVAAAVLPLAGIVFLALLPFIGRRQGKPARWIIVIFWVGTFVLSALTVTGLVFRGEAMRLVLPW